MKVSSPYFALLLGLAVGLALVACAGVQSEHQKIAAACETSAAAADAIASAKAAGRVTQAQAAQALAIYKTTVPFCEPAPVGSLSSVDFAALLAAAAELTTTAGTAK